nr:GNAT family N-acetyltransferase [Sporolactobacillus terrae]
MVIVKLERNDQVPMDLLLLADPSQKMIERYLDRSTCLAMVKENEIVGVCVLIETRPLTMEIVNIAVREKEQGKGNGKKLIEHATDYAKTKGFRRLEVCTGNSSILQLGFYQKCGFSMTGIDKGYFIDHYAQPIFENGIQCRDRIRFAKRLS